MEEKRIIHPIPPLYDADSKILILGSFPSIKSREAMFFYGHPQNRFWRLLARLFGEPEPTSIEEKKALALRHRIALWDSIHACTITGSSDSSVKDVVPNDLSVIFDNSQVERIFCNGRAVAQNVYEIHLPDDRNRGGEAPLDQPRKRRLRYGSPRGGMEGYSALRKDRHY